MDRGWGNEGERGLRVGVWGAGPATVFCVYRVSSDQV
jgi:hypothetical protein